MGHRWQSSPSQGGTLHDVLGGELELDLGHLLLLVRSSDLARVQLLGEELLVPPPLPPPRGNEVGPRPQLRAAPEVDERCVAHELPPGPGPVADRVRWAQMAVPGPVRQPRRLLAKANQAAILQVVHLKVGAG